MPSKIIMVEEAVVSYPARRPRESGDWAAGRWKDNAALATHSRPTKATKNLQEKSRGTVVVMGTEGCIIVL